MVTINRIARFGYLNLVIEADNNENPEKRFQCSGLLCTNCLMIDHVKIWLVRQSRVALTD